jgi:glycosyltransferase involved in cell wall biosynthesis
MALIEAMASGLPIVATAVSGTQQVMISGETGLLIAPGDTQALRDAMLALLSDPVRAQAMGAAARRRVEACFSARKQAEEHSSLYRREWAKSIVKPYTAANV